MQITDLETAVEMYRLIKIMDGGDFLTIKTAKGEISVPKEVQAQFAFEMKRLAYKNLDRLGVERPSVSSATAEYA